MKKIIKSNLAKLQFLKNYIHDYSCWGVEKVYKNISQEEFDFLETILKKNGITSKDGVYINDMYKLIECYFIENEGFLKMKTITLMSNSEGKKKYGLVIGDYQVAEVTIYTSIYSWDVIFKSKDDMVNYKDEVFKIIKEKLI